MRGIEGQAQLQFVFQLMVLFFLQRATQVLFVQVGQFSTDATDRRVVHHLGKTLGRGRHDRWGFNRES